MGGERRGPPSTLDAKAVVGLPGLSEPGYSMASM